MSRIFWDTNLFIYLFEGADEQAERVARLRRRMIERRDQLLTSTLTLGELLVKPLDAGRMDLARRYTQAMETAAAILSFDQAAALAFAEIRRDRSIRPPDAIQLACAAAAGTDLFLTNDRRLARKHIQGIQFIQSLHEAVL